MDTHGHPLLGCCSRPPPPRLTFQMFGGAQCSITPVSLFHRQKHPAPWPCHRLLLRVRCRVPTCWDTATSITQRDRTNTFRSARHVRLSSATKVTDAIVVFDGTLEVGVVSSMGFASCIPQRIFAIPRLRFRRLTMITFLIPRASDTQHPSH